MARATDSSAAPREIELTERQREVLRLIAKGKTNAEIGEALGISLDGAKWHVSEILSRLGVESREEAAAWWRGRERPLAKAGRKLRALLPGPGWAKVAVAGAGLASVGAAVVAVVALRESGGNDALSAVTAPTAAASPSAMATVSPGTSPSATPATTPTGNAAIDALIGPIGWGDAIRINDALQFTMVPCVATRGGIGSPPQCPPGVAEKTPVEVFSMEVGCDGGWIPRSAAASAVRAIQAHAQKNANIFAVVYAKNSPGSPDQTNAPTAKYSVIFGSPGQNADSWYIDIDSGIVREMTGCGYTPEALADFRADSSKPNGGYVFRSGSSQPTPTAPAEPRTLHLDTSPQPQPPQTTRTLGPAPASKLPAWDGTSTVIYDIETGRVLDLGPGSQPASFSPDETKAAWAAGSGFASGTEVYVVDLPSGQKRSLGPGRMAQFIDNQFVVVFAPDSNDRSVVDVVTGSRRPYAGEPIGPILAPPPLSAPGGFLVEPANPNGLAGVKTITIRDATSRAPLLTFDAVAVVAAGKGEVAVAAPPSNGRSNVYVIDIPTGRATYVASAIVDAGSGPFSATADAVLWTDGYCASGPVTLFDRKTGQLVRFDTSGSPGVDRWMLLTPGGLLAAGSFGATYLIDPSTLAYVVVIPSRPDTYSGDVAWSASYRYASHGPYGGHGGLCG